MDRRLVALIGCVVVSILVLAGVLAHFGLVNHGSSAASTATFQNANAPIKFKYPSNWKIQSSNQADSSESTNYLTFQTGKKDKSGNPQHASMAIERWDDASNEPLSNIVPVDLHDSEHLLKFGSCPFTNPNVVECLEITDQAAWVAAGYLPVQTSTFFRVNGAVYAVSWGQTDNFDFQATQGQTILRTMTFNPGS